MGMTHVKATVKNPADLNKQSVVDFLVDSGAIYSVIPSKTLKSIGINPHREQEFVLADGEKVSRKVGDAVFEFEGIRGSAPVVFGKKGDSSLLGAFTLEALGLVLDPFQRKLRPMKMMLM